MDFLQDPTFQRAVRRLQNIPSDRRAILETISSPESIFADQYTRRLMQSAIQASNTEYQNKALDLRKKAFDVDIGLRRRGFENEREQNKLSTAVGLGNVAASTYYGLGRDKIELEDLKNKVALTKRLKQMYGV